MGTNSRFEKLNTKKNDINDKTREREIRDKVRGCTAADIYLLEFGIQVKGHLSMYSLSFCLHLLPIAIFISQSDAVFRYKHFKSGSKHAFTSSVTANALYELLKSKPYTLQATSGSVSEKYHLIFYRTIRFRS